MQDWDDYKTVLEKVMGEIGREVCYGRGQKSKKQEGRRHPAHCTPGKSRSTIARYVVLTVGERYEGCFEPSLKRPTLIQKILDIISY